MSTIKLKKTLQIGDRVEDVFREFRTAMVPPSAVRGASIRILATGGGIDVLSEVFVGERPVLERSELSELATSPVDPQDELVPAEPGLPLERITMSLDNQSGAVRIVNIRLLIREL